MVIYQFNKLIRNKWLWGAFAVAISLFFAFDFLVADLGSDRAGQSGTSVGTLGGKPVDGGEFATVAEDLRGLGRNRDWKLKSWEVNRSAWELLAAMAVAERCGIVATDADVRNAIRSDRAFLVNGQFSFALYEKLLRDNSITPERYEAFIKRNLTLERIGGLLAGSASWVSPMELELAVKDVTDVLTVRVAHFNAVKEDDPGEVTDEQVKKWYDENSASLALPERCRINFVRYDVNDPKAQAKVTVTENEMRDYYDATSERYTETDTNGVETVKKFEEVSAEIEKELRKLATAQFYETNLLVRAYAEGAAGVADVSRLEAIAAEDELKVESSAFFSLEEKAVEGFCQPTMLILPGAKNLAEAVAELDSSSEELRYGVVTSDEAVWLVEKAEVSPAHTPTFEEAKDVIRPRVRRALREEAFKARVEGVIAGGTNAVLAAEQVSTNLTFVVCDMVRGEFPDQNEVAAAARRLSPGGISDFVRLSASRALVVVCIDRKAGDTVKAQMLRTRLQGEAGQLMARQAAEAWRKANLVRLGFEPGEGASVTEVTEEYE